MKTIKSKYKCGADIIPRINNERGGPIFGVACVTFGLMLETIWRGGLGMATRSTAGMMIGCRMWGS